MKILLWATNILEVDTHKIKKKKVIFIGNKKKWRGRWKILISSVVYPYNPEASFFHIS